MTATVSSIKTNSSQSHAVPMENQLTLLEGTYEPNRTRKSITGMAAESITEMAKRYRRDHDQALFCVVAENTPLPSKKKKKNLHSCYI